MSYPQLTTRQSVMFIRISFSGTKIGCSSILSLAPFMIFLTVGLVPIVSMRYDPMFPANLFFTNPYILLTSENIPQDPSITAGEPMAKTSQMSLAAWPDAESAPDPRSVHERKTGRHDNHLHPRHEGAVMDLIQTRSDMSGVRLHSLFHPKS